LNFLVKDLAQESRARQRWVLLIMAAGAMLLILWQFSPRYVLWPSVKIPTFNREPDTHRAFDTILQLYDPFKKIENSSNRVIEWRLLFPVIFHYLGLPVTLFLAMPWVGCLLVLWYIIKLVWDRTHDLVVSIAGTLLLGTTSWFFTSTAWLTYFDSWYVLGGLILAFSRSWKLVLLAALLTPWIDERIVFMIPACLAARAAIHWNDTGRVMPDREQWRILIAGAVPLFCYTLIRIAAVVWFDKGSSEYVASIESRIYPAGPLANGVWMGLRLAWLPVLALPVVVAARSRALAIAAAGATAFCVIVALILAADVSRSMSILLPVALAGLLIMSRFHSNARPLVLALAAGNLLLPAAHVVSSFRVPIFDARYEIEHLKTPPYYLDERYHLAQAKRYYEAGQMDGVGRSLIYASELTDLPDELATVMADYGDKEAARGRFDYAAIFYKSALETGTDAWQKRAIISDKLTLSQQKSGQVSH
jgi:hypothetical protein